MSGIRLVASKEQRGSPSEGRAIAFESSVVKYVILSDQRERRISFEVSNSTAYNEILRRYAPQNDSIKERVNPNAVAPQATGGDIDRGVALLYNQYLRKVRL